MNPTDPKRRWCWLIAVSVLLALAVSCGAEYPKAKVTVRVVDDAENPTKGAQVSTTFVRRHIFSSTKRIQQKRKTGKSGKASAFGRTSSDRVFLSAQKTGFCKTHNMPRGGAVPDAG